MDSDDLFAYPDTTPEAPPPPPPLLDDADDNEWRTLLSYMQTRHFYAGEAVCTEGEFDRALYLLTVGALEIASGAAPGIEIEAPSTLNLIAFLDDGRCAATARALSDGEVVRLSYDAFEALAVREPVLARKLLLDLARILAHTLRFSRA